MLEPALRAYLEVWGRKFGNGTYTGELKLITPPLVGELKLSPPGFPKSLIHPAAQNGVFRENANSPSWKLIPPKS